MIEAGRQMNLSLCNVTFSLVFILALGGFVGCSTLTGSNFEKECHESWCYSKESLEGWTVHYAQDFEKDRIHFTEVRKHLAEDLQKITQTIPPSRVSELREISIYVSRSDPQGRSPFGVYHYSKDVLIERGMDPEKFQSIELANSKNYLNWTKSQPAAVLHEFAHAYFHRFLTFDQKNRITLAYKAAVKRGNYRNVPYYSGTSTFKKDSYALKDEYEYFCEAVEAYFWRNDYFPFTREDLKKHDPRIFNLLVEIWEDPQG